MKVLEKEERISKIIDDWCEKRRQERELGESEEQQRKERLKDAKLHSKARKGK